MLLGLLLAAYVLNFADRTLISVLQEGIRLEFGLSDRQLGLLGGLSFALFYSILGIPIARLAERRSRTLIIAGAISCWSIMTMMCGAVISFAQLFLCRVGVGVGEAGGTPPSHSLIADRFPPEYRSTAMAIYCLGVPLGSLAGALIGGYLAEQVGWRLTFVLFGLPGLPLALCLAVMFRDAPRQQAESLSDQISLWRVIRHLATTPALLHVTAGLTIASLSGYAIAAFNVSYFIRAFGLGPAPAGAIVALAGAVWAGLGTFLGGWLSDRWSVRNPAWQYRIPAIGLIIAAPLFAVAYSQTRLELAIALLIVPSAAQFLYLGPSYAIAQNLVPGTMRATISALLLFFNSLLGLGLGPLVLGSVSDFLAIRSYGGNYSEECLVATAQSVSCLAASTDGLRGAILIILVGFIWAAGHYLAAGRRR